MHIPSKIISEVNDTVENVGSAGFRVGWTDRGENLKMRDHHELYTTPNS